MAGPAGSPAELQVKMATARLLMLPSLKVNKTNIVMHSRDCTAPSIPGGSASPFFSEAFLPTFQNALAKPPSSESGPSDGTSTAVFPYQLKAN